MIQVAIMGHGVVGCGVAELLQHNAAVIAGKAGEQLKIAKILDLRDFPELPYAELFTHRFEDIVENPEIQIVVETMGGLHPAYDYVKACLDAGKSVVTSNKELVAQKGDELLALAKAHKQNFLFEASVGGGIPILRPLDQCLSANRIQRIAGILNGTTNFMLTEMIENGLSFDEALADAQNRGYAERDPSADVDGLDACRKICILASLGFGNHVYPDEVHTEGIRNITLTDVRCAEAAGGVIKLIGLAVREDEHIRALVAPMVVKKDNMLSHIGGVFNGVQVTGDAVGDTLFYGRGAGKEPTASAVVADVIDAAKHLGRSKYLHWGPQVPGLVADYQALPMAYMVRLAGETREAAAAAATAAYEDITPISADIADNEFVCITPELSESDFEDKTALLKGVTLVSRIRLL